MPTKFLASPFGRDGFTQKSHKFGGGADTIFTANVDESGDPLVIGYNIDARGGNDAIYGSDFEDNLTGGNGDDMIIGGGGDDTINGGNADGSPDSGKGKNSVPTNILVGDGERQADGSYTSDVSFLNSLIFDGGDDSVTGGVGGASNRIYGDAADVNMGAGSTFNGGDDTLIGGSGSTNSMYGDANNLAMVAGSTFNGGDDTLRAGDSGANTMIGDVAHLSGEGTFQGGNDTLYSGAGNDRLVGDFGTSGRFSGTAIGGADIFVFAKDFGFDSIADFQVDLDTINLAATGLSWVDLDNNMDGVLDGSDEGVFINGGITTQIDFGVLTNGDFQGFLTISNVTGFTEDDFDFGSLLLA